MPVGMRIRQPEGYATRKCSDRHRKGSLDPPHAPGRVRSGPAEPPTSLCTHLCSPHGLACRRRLGTEDREPAGGEGGREATSRQSFRSPRVPRFGAVAAEF